MLELRLNIPNSFDEVLTAMDEMLTLTGASWELQNLPILSVIRPLVFQAHQMRIDPLVHLVLPY